MSNEANLTTNIENIYGIGSFRQCSGFPSIVRNNGEESSDYIYETTLNGCIQIYNYSKNKRLKFFQASHDIIVLLLYNKQLKNILTCSYSGKLVVWNENYEKLIEYQARINHVHYGTWTNNGQLIYLCSRFDGTIISLKYEQKENCLIENWLRHWSVENEEIHPFVEHSTHLAPPVVDQVETSNTYVAGSIGYECVLCTDDQRLWAILQRSQQHVKIHQLKASNGQLEKELQLEPAKTRQMYLCSTINILIIENYYDITKSSSRFSVGSNKRLNSTSSSTTSCREFFAVGLQSGLIFIIDASHLEIYSIIRATGSPQALIWYKNDLLTVGYISGTVNLWNLNGQLLAIGDGAPTIDICHLQWENEENNLLWMGGYVGLALVKIEQEDEEQEDEDDEAMISNGNVIFSLNTSTDSGSSLTSLKYKLILTTLIKKSYHETAGCGLSYLSSSDQIISGDLSGNLYNWPLNSSEPRKHLLITDSIRCLSSIKNTNIIFIGTLSGNFYICDINHSDDFNLIHDFNTAVICMTWNNDCTQCLIGLANGHLVIMYYEQQASQHHSTRSFLITSVILPLSKDKIVHIQLVETTGIHCLEQELEACTSSTNDHYRPAEIWSVCYSPNELYCATSSEDQTTAIWKIDDLINSHYNQLSNLRISKAILTGHTTAVTSCSWTLFLSVNKYRILTCADDRTVRIYNGLETDDEHHYCFIQMIKAPENVFGWFTLTYIQIDSEKNLILCVTQNGYLIIWKLLFENEDYENAASKVHLCFSSKIHFGSLEGLCYDKSEQRLATIGSDCTITILKLNLTN
ncbi:unnamed protein product [Didymodactylos carnosus]|uniref:Uncharacterized protein n=1 Tax=Didymodactylos carnosus TaxID=1234261 RepID=A0A813TYD5_9BILA|nr:unnamed protein product [Didymodactylos carnosus]CAF0815892.1 unnamed protein product [Didymodactylos carnosus]CAF3575732.1 unnamed protein product [Didymodactylos carnosus]CAF3601975.1 unnamed protein product [Didymodactylos carnosus]